MAHLHPAAAEHGSALVLLTVVALALLYSRGYLRSRCRASSAIAAWRAGSFFLGLFLIWLALASPLAGLDHALLTAHMLQHLLLMTLAPALVWLGAPVRAILRGVPPRFASAIMRQLRRSKH